jgi:membrane protease YdiL (CAAX protease family)
LLKTVQAAAAGVLVFILLWRRGQPLKSTGWHPLLGRIAIQFGIAVMFLTVFLQGKLFVILGGVDSSLWIAFLLLLITSLSEETVFRGYLQMRFSSFWNPITAWLVTAGLFVLWQLPGLLPALDFANGAVYILSLLILRALLVGWMMLKTRHVFAPAIYRALSAWLMMI